MGLLADHLYKNRCLLVFAPAPDSAELAQQMKTIRSATADLLEHDITVVEVPGDEEVLIDGAAADDCDAGELRVEFGVDNHEFALILVSKDGAIQLHSEEPVAQESLVQTVGHTANYEKSPHSTVAPY